jgi:hypothetical protein
MQNNNLALALDPQADGTAQEELRDELAQFISQELIAVGPEINVSAQSAAHPKPALTVVKRRASLWNYRSMDTRFNRRRIHVDNGEYTLFRVR